MQAGPPDQEQALNKRFDIVALGEAMVEFNQTHASEPHYLQGFGGDTSNAIIAAARAQARVAYISRVGDDHFGQTLLDLWAREGVDCTAVERDARAATGVYFVTHSRPEHGAVPEHTGHRFSYLRANSAASQMTPQWLDGPAAALIRQARILHVSGISMGISASACDTVFAAIGIAREAGTLVSLDANLRLKLWPLERARACIARAVALCDLFLPSHDDALALSGLQDPHHILDWAHAMGAAQVVLKIGADGALASDGTRRERIAGHSVTVQDATGAGDCFGGNLLARLCQGDDWFHAARYANAAAALSVQGFGAVAPLPRPEQVRKLIA